MSEMIERVARAIAAVKSGDGSDLEGLIDAVDNEYGTSTDTDAFFRDLARAAIEALREPTDSMVNKGCNRLIELVVPYPEETAREVYDDMLRRALGDEPCGNPSELRQLKQAMIDAALSPPPLSGTPSPPTGKP